MITRLAHVCIETCDLEATENFYGILGIERKFEFRNLQDELIGMYLAVNADNFIELVKIREPKGEGSLAHFTFEVEDVDQVCDQLRQHDITVTEKKLGVDHTWMVTCHDPNGIFIEFHQYTEDSLQLRGGSCCIDYKP
jgi:catechol 2,3-dioxygenase-like lactoylglutathione lyase family enzyme